MNRNLGAQWTQPKLPLPSRWEEMRGRKGPVDAGWGELDGNVNDIAYEVTEDKYYPNDDMWEYARNVGLTHNSDHDFSPGGVVLPPSRHGRGANWSVSDPEVAYAKIGQREVNWEQDILSGKEDRGLDPGWGSTVYPVRALRGDRGWDDNWAGSDSVTSNVGFEVTGPGQKAPEWGKDEWSEHQVPPLMRGYQRTMAY